MPTPQVLVYGDDLTYPGFLRSFSIDDLPNMERNKLAGMTTFIMLPIVAPFDDEPSFYSHKTIVKQVVSLLRFSKKQDKATTIWLAYCSRKNATDSSFATLINRCIDLIPTLSFLFLSVVCPIIHLASRDPASNTITAHTSPLDHPFILLQLTSSALPKKPVVRTVEFPPRQRTSETPASMSIYHPQPC